MVCLGTFISDYGIISTICGQEMEIMVVRYVSDNGPVKFLDFFDAVKIFVKILVGDDLFHCSSCYCLRYP